MAENKAFESIMNGLTESLEFTKEDTSKARKMSVTVAELSQYHGGKKLLQDYNVVTVNKNVKTDRV